MGAPVWGSHLLLRKPWLEQALQLWSSHWHWSQSVQSVVQSRWLSLIRKQNDFTLVIGLCMRIFLACSPNSMWEMVSPSHQDVVFTPNKLSVMAVIKCWPECCCMWSHLLFQSISPSTRSPMVNSDVVKWTASAPRRFTRSTGAPARKPLSSGWIESNWVYIFVY